MSSLRLPFVCLAVATLVPFACAKSGDSSDDDSTSSGPTSTASTTGVGGTSNGPGPGAGGSGNTGGNSAGGAGGTGTGTGGMLMCDPGTGGSGGAASCTPSGDCEVCAQAQCTSDWNTCCSTTGCIELSRCVFDKCDADPYALTCINSMCASEYAAAGGLGGPGSLAGIALGSCLQNQLTTPPTTACACCDMQVNGP